MKMAGSSCLMGACLLFMVLSWHSASQASAEPELVRTAALLRGSITSSRSVLEVGSQVGRASRTLVESSTQLYVLGLPVEHQDEVHAALSSSGGHMLHVLPGDDLHWLVASDHTGISKLLNDHHHLTAAPFPDTFKLSAPVEQLMAVAQTTLPLTRSAAPPHLQPFLSPGPGPARVVLMALGSHAQSQHLATLTAHLDTHLNTAGVTSPGCPAHATMAAPFITVQLCAQDAGRVVEALLPQSEITWLELMAEAVLQDLYAGAILQARPLINETSYSPPDLYGGDSQPFFPYWAAGLDGQGEIVGVSDTGADLDSCLLWDPSQTDYLTGSKTTTIPPAVNATTYDQLFSNVTVYQDPAARKVVMYSFSGNSDGLDSVLSHGTHVVTSLVGSVYGNQDPTSSPDFITGIVPNAKVAFHDLGKTFPDGTSNGTSLIVSWNTFAGVTYRMQQLGVGVLSNSWVIGQSDRAGYVSAQCAILNALVYDLDTVLIMFGAGNDGRDLSKVNTTGVIGRGASCANVVAVGATESFTYHGLFDAKFNLTVDGVVSKPTPEDFVPFADVRHGSVVTRFGAIPFRPVPLFLYQNVGADVSWWPLRGRTVPMLLASPVDACQPVSNTPAAGGDYVLLVVRSQACPLETMFLNAGPTAGRVGVLTLYTNLTQIGAELGQNLPLPDPTVFAGLPFGAVYFANATEGSNAVGAVSTGNVTITWDQTGLTNVSAPVQFVAEFSSYGASAAFDTSRQDRVFRIKPEVVAPGVIMAGASDGKYSGQMDQCTSVTQKGTSMATPQAAGAAVIARQYFVKGFYPAGAAGGKGFTPSSTLLRAALVAGAQTLRGTSRSTKTSLNPPPSQFQGFGAVSLTNSLPLQGDISNGNRIQIIHNASFAKTGDVHTYNITLDSAGSQSLVVAMCFNDLPAFPGAASSAVNDLDLVIEGPAANTPTGTGTWFPNGLIRPDPVNNIERIVIRPTVPGTYKVTVKATFLSTNASSVMGMKNTYSLVMLGPISNTIPSPYNPASDQWMAPAPTSRDVAATPSPSTATTVRSAATQALPLPLATLALASLLLLLVF